MALCVIVLFLSSLMLFIITGFGTILCPTQHVFSDKDIEEHKGVDSGVNFMSINGDVYDFSGFAGTHNSLASKAGSTSTAATSSFYTYAGKDASVFFPRRDGVWTPACTFDGVSRPVTNNPAAKCNADGKYCHNVPQFVKDVLYKSIGVFKIGSLALAMGDINVHNSLDPDVTYWTVVDSRVYDVCLSP